MLREFVAARGRGDGAEMVEWWKKLLQEEWDVLRGMVQAAGRRGVLQGAAEIDDAVAEAADRVARHGARNWKGSDHASFRAWLKAVARTSCLDVQRNAARRNEKEGYSVDETDPESGDEKGWVVGRYAELERERVAVEEAASDEDDEFAHGRAFLDWALPQISTKRRTVVELLLDGVRPDDVATRLGISRNSVDVTKKRALKDLEKLKELYPS